MKKFNKDKLIGVATYGFWFAYAGLISATIYGTIYHFKTLKTIKNEVHTLLEMKRGYW